MEDLADHELLSLIRADNAEALELLLRRYYATVFSFCARWAGRDDIDDLTQEVLLKAARTIRQFRGDSKVSTWLFTVVRSVVFDAGRSKKRRELLLAKVEGHAITSDALYDESEQCQRVRDSLQELPEKERFCILLNFYQGLSHREISEILKCSEVTVSWYLHRARKQLKSILGGLS